MGPDETRALSGFVSSAASQTAPFEIDDLFRIEYAIDPRISPDGTQVVFVRESVDTMDDRWHGNLWSVSEDGAMRQITTGHHYDSSPRISPDGQRIAFLSDRDGSTQIYLQAVSAGAEQPVLRLTDLDPRMEPWGLAWSPDGSTLSFVGREHTVGLDLGVLSPPPPGATWGVPPRMIDRLVYRRDGRGYLDPGCERLYLLAVDAPPARRTVRRATRVAECLDEASIDPVNHRRDGSGPEWTPDGRHLVVAAHHRREREQYRSPIDLDLFEIEIATGAMRPLVVRQGLDGLPTVSPDGTKIAFLGFVDRRMSHQSAELYVANRDGSAVRSLTATLGHDVDSPRWTADGRAVLVQYHDGGVTRVVRFGLDGGSTRVAEGLSDGYGAYDGGGFTVSRTDRIAFTHSRPDQPGEVAVADFGPATSPARRLTRLNQDLMSERRVSPVVPVQVESVGGQTIEGWLVRPVRPAAEAALGPPPLILDIHGGPFLNYGARFDLEKQIHAARGFAVLYLNPRGSTGYGEDFANLIHHDYPGDDVKDLLAAVDLMVARGEADPDRLFVTGGSGGGLLTLSLTAETSRFRAAVAIYPLVNWTTFVLTSDLAPLALTRWLPGPPWQHRDHYLDRSPIWKVGRMDTPTLVIAGEEDYRTPISEAEQIFAALQLRGVDSVFVRLPEATHFAERRPSHYRARIAYGLHWFERYLERPPGRHSEPGEVSAPPALE